MLGTRTKRKAAEVTDSSLEGIESSENPTESELSGSSIVVVSNALGSFADFLPFVPDSPPSIKIELEELAFETTMRAHAKRSYQAPLIIPHTVLTELSSLRTYMESYRNTVWPACLTPPRPVETLLGSTDSWEISCAYSTLALGARSQGNLAHANEFIQKACVQINADMSEQPHCVRLAALNSISFFYKSNCDFGTALHYNRFARELAKTLLARDPEAPWPASVSTDLTPEKMIMVRHLCFESICSSLTMGNEAPTMSAQLLMYLLPFLAKYNEQPHDLLFDRFVKAICIMPALSTTPIDELHKVEQPLSIIFDEISAVASSLDAPAIVVRWLVVIHGMLALINLLRGNRDEAIRCADLTASVLVEKGPAYWDMNTCVAVFWASQVHMRLDFSRYTWDLSLLSEMAKFAKMAFFIQGYLRILERDVPLFKEMPFAVTTIPLHIYPPDAALAASIAAAKSSPSSPADLPLLVDSSPPSMPLAVPPKPLDDKTIREGIIIIASDPKSPAEMQRERFAVIHSAATEYMAVYTTVESGDV